MARRIVTVAHSVVVARAREAVFDYTQDPARRSEWDPGFRSAELMSEEPRRVRGVQDGIGPVTVEYKLFRRPERTSAAFVDTDSRWMSGGGGSWSYEPTADGAATAWTQTNTIQLRHARLGVVLGPMVRWSLARSMRRSMAAAATILEAERTAAG